MLRPLPRRPDGHTLEWTRLTCGVVVMAAGSAALAGWWLGIPALTSFLSGLTTMKGNSALGFVLAGLALLLLPFHPRLARSLAVTIMVIAGITLGEYLLGTRSGFDDLLVRHPEIEGVRWPGRMSVPAAVALGLVAWALLLAPRVGRARWPAAVFLALLAGGPGLFAVFDMLFEAHIMAQLPHAAGSMSLPAALGSLVLSLGAQAAMPRSGLMRLLSATGAAGRVGRLLFLILLPGATLLVVATHLAVRMGTLPAADTMVVRTVVLILVIVVVSWRSLDHIAVAERAEREAFREVDAARQALEARVAERTASLVDANTALTGEILERRRLSDELAEREEHFRTLVEGVPVGIVLFDAEGRTTYANPRMTAITGRSSDSLISAGWATAFHPDDAEAMSGQWHVAMREVQACECEGRFMRPDGTVVWVRGRLQPLLGMDGQARGFVATVADVTEAVTARRALADREARLRLTLDQAEIGLWHWRIAEERLELDANCEELLGYPAGSLTGSLDRWSALMHPEDREPVLAARAAHLADPAVLYDVEYRARHRDGHWIWVNSRGRVVESVAGRPTRMMGVIQDVTARRQVEERMRRQKADLEHLLHVVSHDLREPLRAVKGFAQMAERDPGSSLSPEGQALLRRGQAAAERLDRLISDIGVLARARFREIAPERLAAADLVKEVLARLETRIAESGATVTVAPDLGIVIADRTWATQALYNLVLNALKYVRPGSPPEVRVAPGGRDGRTGLVVLDRGPGVPGEHAERIFTLFQRNVGREVEGTGAGLAIVRQVARRHGGDAWVKPRPGGGSAFFVTFGERPETAAAA